MDEERKNELNEAVNDIARFNLWRRGRTDCYSRKTAFAKELGESLDIVCGGVLDYLELQKDFDRVVQQRDAMMETVKQAVADSRELARVKAERNHFKAILSALRIPHKRKHKRNGKNGK